MQLFQQLNQSEQLTQIERQSAEIVAQRMAGRRRAADCFEYMLRERAERMCQVQAERDRGTTRPWPLPKTGRQWRAFLLKGIVLVPAVVFNIAYFTQ